MAGLPAVSPQIGLNRADPLGSSTYAEFLEACKADRYERMLDHALECGERTVQVQYYDGAKTKIRACELPLGNVLSFFVPLEIVKAWDLERNPKVRAQYDISESERHPRAYVQWGGLPFAYWGGVPSDVGRRVGVRIFKTINGKEIEHWFLRQVDEERGQMLANSIHDWITGKIQNPTTHVWADRRIPFIGPEAIVHPQRVESREKKRKAALAELDDVPSHGPTPPTLPISEPQPSHMPTTPASTPSSPTTVMVRCSKCKSPASHTLDKTLNWHDGVYITKARDVNISNAVGLTTAWGYANS